MRAARWRWLVFFVAVVVQWPTLAEDAVVTLHSTVTGSKEQPRVMYIVPWQEPEAAPLDYALDNQLVQEVFAPIDRDEFMREIQLQSDINQRMNNSDSETR